jgi:hypothetical protein
MSKEQNGTGTEEMEHRDGEQVNRTRNPQFDHSVIRRKGQERRNTDKEDINSACIYNLKPQYLCDHISYHYYLKGTVQRDGSGEFC